jgi:hypothetical protein
LPFQLYCCRDALFIIQTKNGRAVPCLRRPMPASFTGGPGLILGQSFWIKVGQVSPRVFRVYININIPLMLYIRPFIYLFINPSIHLLNHHRHRFSS